MHGGGGGVVTAYERGASYAELARHQRERAPVRRAGDLARMLAPKSAHATQEIAWVVTLDIYGDVVGIHEVARGARDRVDIAIPVVLETVLKDGTNYFILLHNHPSGSAVPSEDDGLLTWAVAEGAAAAGIVLLDHVVLGRDREYYSFYEGELCRTTP